DFLREQYSTTFSSSAGADRLIFEDFLDARTYAGKEPIDAKELIATGHSGDAINFTVLRKFLFRLATSDGFKTNPEKQQLFVRAKEFFNRGEDPYVSFSSIKARKSSEKPNLIERLSPFQGKPPPTTEELRCYAIDAVLLTPVRQEPDLGSCFVSSAAINLQMNNPGKFMQLFKAMICDDGILAKNAAGNHFLVGTNFYERRGHDYSTTKILQHALMRTFADALTLTGRRVLDPTAIDFRQKMEGLNDLVAAAGITLGRIICDDLKFDSASKDNDLPYRNAHDRSNGEWIPHVSIEGNPEMQNLHSEVAIAEITKIANANGKLLNEEIRKKIRETEKILTNPKATEEEKALVTSQTKTLSERAAMNATLLANLAALRGLKPEAHGWAGMTLASLGITSFSETPSVNLKSCLNAQEVFEHWCDYLLKESENIIAKGEVSRVLVYGSGHEYNLAPTNSSRICQALRRVRANCSVIDPNTNMAYLDPDANRDAIIKMEITSMLNEINNGSEFVFIDPNWDGYTGVGIRRKGSGPDLELFMLQEDGQTYSFEPPPADGPENAFECFFVDLYGY
ncbi:MAG: hypothetical protein LBB14_02430, partial [Puniceicoccales bacterium]|nr:hypothetical protein [Puniceicoccales bacterium]